MSLCIVYLYRLRYQPLEVPLTSEMLIPSYTPSHGTWTWEFPKGFFPFRSHFLLDQGRQSQKLWFSCNICNITHSLNPQNDRFFLEFTCTSSSFSTRTFSYFIRSVAEIIVWYSCSCTLGLSWLFDVISMVSRLWSLQNLHLKGKIQHFPPAK